MNEHYLHAYRRNSAPIEEPSAPRQPLNESGFARLARILRGDVPRINSIGIVTAENPNGQALTARENSRRNIDFRTDLQYSFRQIKGKYGSLENPFLLVNISRDETIKMGVDHGQAAVIYGQRAPEGEGMIFELISTSNTVPDQGPVGTVLGTASKFLYQRTDPRFPQYKDGKRVKQTPEPVDPDDPYGNFYSEYQGRKFKIPFINDMQEESEFRGAEVLNYYRSEIPNDPKILELLELFLARNNALEETLRRINGGEMCEGGKFLYARRVDQVNRSIEFRHALGHWKASPKFTWEDTWNPNHHLITPYSA